MHYVELTNAKGGKVWINPHWIVCIGSAESGGGDMYGDSNARSTTKLQFLQGAAVEVKEPIGDVITRLSAAAA
jgi:hypothetical protein